MAPASFINHLGRKIDTDGLRASRGRNACGVTGPAGNIEYARTGSYVRGAEERRHGLSRNRSETAVISGRNFLPALMFELMKSRRIDRVHRSFSFQPSVLESGRGRAVCGGIERCRRRSG